MDFNSIMHFPRYVCLFTFFLELYQVIIVYSSSTIAPICTSGQFTHNGECCTSCPPAEGAISFCGERDTVCAPCQQNSTYSIGWSAEACRTCIGCNSDEVTVQGCNLTHDSTCRCKTGLFRKGGGSCSQCNVCPPGYGTIQPCTFLEDIICEKCVPLKTYSDAVTRATMCKPCSRCRRGSTVVENCTVYSDTVCSSPPSDDITPTSGSDSTGTPYHHGASIVPLYCVLLAALVIGLLIYVLFKRWSFHQLKLRASQKMIRSNTSSTDIEKNSADTMNGSQLLTTTTYTGPSSYVVAVSPPSHVSPTTLYKELPREKRIELEEKLRNLKNYERDWRALCMQLHFSESDMTIFSNSMEGHLDIVHQMINKWQTRDGSKATANVLAQALHNINREDLANIIYTKNESL